MIKRLIASLALALIAAFVFAPTCALAYTPLLASESPPFAAFLMPFQVAEPFAAPVPVGLSVHDYAMKRPSDRNPLLEHSRARLQPRPALLE